MFSLTSTILVAAVSVAAQQSSSTSAMSSSGSAKAGNTTTMIPQAVPMSTTPLANTPNALLPPVAAVGASNATLTSAPIMAVPAAGAAVPASQPGSASLNTTTVVPQVAPAGAVVVAGTSTGTGTGTGTGSAPKIAAAAMDASTDAASTPQSASQQDMVTQALQQLIKDVSAMQNQQAAAGTTSSVSKRQTDSSDTETDDRQTDAAADTSADPLTTTTLGSTYANPNMSNPVAGSGGPFVIPLLTGPGLTNSSVITTSGYNMTMKKRQTYNVANAGMDAFRNAAETDAPSSELMVSATNSTTAAQKKASGQHTSGANRQVAISGLLFAFAMLMLLM